LIHCSLLNPALDVLYRIQEFRSGSTYLDIPFAAIPAGKGINVARVIKELGEDVCVTGLMSEFDLQQVERYLQCLQIQSRFFVFPGGMRINTTVKEQNSGFVTHFNSAGPTLTSRIQHEFLDFIKPMIGTEDFWCFSGSVVNGFDNDIYHKLIRYCSDAGAGTLLDTRGDFLKVGIRAKPDFIKPNLTELEEFFDEQVQGVHHIALKAKRFIDMGVSYVFISLGADGLIAIHENDCLLCSAPQVKIVDTIGCGDALVGGLLVAQKRNFSFPEMCRMAIACGTSKAMHDGPGIITREEVWQLMEDVKITAV